MKSLPLNPSESTKRRNPDLWRESADRDEFAQSLSVIPDYETKPKKRIRQSSKSRLNKLETEFLSVLRDSIGDKPTIKDQAMRFELATGLWYKPDFVVFFPVDHERRPWCIEVKGPKAWRGGFENLKMAARVWPSFAWTLVWKLGEGQWKEQDILP